MTVVAKNPPLINSLEYNNRVLKYVLIPDYLQKLSTHGNLKEALLKVQMMTHDQIVGDFMPDMFTPDVPEKTKQTVLTIIRKKTEEENKKKIDDYLPIIFNQPTWKSNLCRVSQTSGEQTHQPQVRRIPTALMHQDDRGRPLPLPRTNHAKQVSQKRTPAMLS